MVTIVSIYTSIDIQKTHMCTYVSLSIRNILYNNDNENSNLSQKAKKKKIARKAEIKFSELFFFFCKFCFGY